MGALVQSQLAEEKPLFPVTKLATHVNPHIDEICAFWLLRRFGTELFPGVQKAPVEFWSEGTAMLQKGGVELLKEGILCVGIGGGMFDEHPTTDQDRKKGDCAATLIAKYLGVDDDPALEQVLDFVRRDDLNGSGSAFELGSLCRKMYSILPPEKVIIWAIMAIEAVYGEQVNFAKEAAAEFASKAKLSTVKQDGRMVARVVTIESDNEVVAKFARSSRGGSATLVIQKGSGGNIQIYANRKWRVNMDKIARFIRLEEQKVQGRMKTLKPADLVREGTVPGAECWYYFKKGQMLLNGSISHPDVSATGIPLERIKETVIACCF